MNSDVAHSSLSALGTRFCVASAHIKGEDIVATGCHSVDARLNGGLLKGAVHEVFAGESGDSCTAAAFAVLLTLRAARGRPLVWLREDRREGEAGRLYAPGLTELGVDPASIVAVSAPDTLALLRAGADVVACGTVGTVIIEPWGRAAALDLTASRRLALAAARSGVMTVIVRADAEPAPSAAQTRWRVAAAPSAALGSNAPGLPAFDVSLLRHRGGVAGFDARMEWNRDRGSFGDATLSRRVPAAVAGRARDQGERRVA